MSAPPPRRRRSWIWRLSLFVLVVGAIVYAGWEGWRRWQALTQAEDAALEHLSTELAALKTDLNRLAAREEKIERAAGESSTSLASLRAKLEQSDQAIGRLALDAQGGRARLQLAVVEQLLLLANDRALLARDAAGAALALEQAEVRLASVNDPRLFRLREAIAQERGALRAVAQVDAPAIALSLANLVEQIPRLPLQAVPARRSEPEAVEPEFPAAIGAIERVWQSLRRALRASFSIRRDEGPAPRLLPREQEALITQLLIFKLEGARLALLRGDGQAFRDFCAGARAWLGDYFRVDDPGVQAARDELAKLGGLEIAPRLPELSRSLAILRELLDATPP